MNKKKYVGKTYARNNFSAIVNDVKGGTVYYVSDRGKVGFAIVPLSVLEKQKEKKLIPISKTSAYGIFADRKDMEDAVKWVREKRHKRLKRIYGK